MPYHVGIQVDPDGYPMVIVTDKDRGWIEERIAAPWRQGTPTFIDGRVLSWESIRVIHIVETDKTAKQIITAYKRAGYDFQWFLNFNNVLYGDDLLHGDAEVQGRDVTDEFLTGLPGTGSGIGPGAASAADRKAVMVIYGHDTEANVALFDWLRTIGLRPLEWAQLVRDCDSTSPYIGDVLEEAFRRAQAVIAYFTPDETVIARNPLPGNRFATPRGENTSRLQARPNVLFEAGMAFVTHPNRTVLAVLGDPELPSDLAGRHYVRLSHTQPESLNDLASRLEKAGCDTDLSGSDWLNAARFPDRANLASSPAPRPRPAAPPAAGPHDSTASTSGEPASPAADGPRIDFGRRRDTEGGLRLPPGVGGSRSGQTPREPAS